MHCREYLYQNNCSECRKRANHFDFNRTTKHYSSRVIYANCKIYFIQSFRRLQKVSINQLLVCFFRKFSFIKQCNWHWDTTESTHSHNVIDDDIQNTNIWRRKKVARKAKFCLLIFRCVCHMFIRFRFIDQKSSNNKYLFWLCVMT